jgi:hypothetical protein
MGDSIDTVSDHEGSADRDTTELGVFERRRFQERTVPTALDLLLDTLDECRHLLQDSRSSRSQTSPSLALEYGKKLSARERKELDQAVDRYRADLKIEIPKELDRIHEQNKLREQNKVKSGEGDALYPFSPETEAAMFGMIFNRINAQMFNKHFSEFADSFSSYEYIQTKLRLGSNSNKELMLGTALLPLIVSKTEEFLAALVRAGLSLFPRALGEPPSVPNDIIIKYQQNILSSDIHRWQIDQRVTEFMNQSPTEWRKQLERWTRIDIADLGADWDMLNEMIQRRHVIIHNGARADIDYLSRVAPRLRHGLYLGSALECNFTYIEPVLIELETWATCLALRWSKNFFKGVDVYDTMILGGVTRLESNGRWTQGLAILDSFLVDPVSSDAHSVILAQINRLFCLQELGRDSDSVQREIKTWGLDESAEPFDKDYLEIGRWALLRDYERLMGAVHKYTTGTYENYTPWSKRDLREMPLIKRAMQESRQFCGFMLSSGSSPQSPQGITAGPRKTRKRRRK